MPLRPHRPPMRAWTESALAAGGVLALCTAALLHVYGPWSDWLNTPLIYGDDGLWNLFIVKTVLQTGWYASNPLMGAPFEANFLDFAKPEVLHLAFYRFAGLFTQNIALVHNLFYGLGFPLVALSALGVLRRGFGLTWPMAITGALLFTFVPYHFFRLEHVFLSSYYAVPMAAWLMLQVAGERPPFHEKGRLGAGHWTVWVASAVLASTSIYYAFFGLCLIFATGALETLRQRAWKHLASASLVCALLSSLVLINLAPSLWHRHLAGRNPEIAARTVQEVEMYALRPLSLILPSNQHRSPTLASWAHAYETGASVSHEGRATALGVLGSTGFLLLLLALMSGHPSVRKHSPLGIAARANAAALILATAGGAGSLIAVAFDASFRALNRISIAIAFFAIASLLLLVQHWAQTIPSRWQQPVLTAVAALLLAFGLWDQVPANVRPPSEQIAAHYASDRAFVRRIEEVLPPGSRILQLPYTAFPEAPPHHQEGTYSPLRGFLHSDRLRWSYGGMRGREGALWLQTLTQQPTPLLLHMASAHGFSGIWLDRRAVPDHGAQLESELRANGLPGGFSSADGSLVFYELNKAGTPTTRLSLALPLLGKGFYGWEQDDVQRWAWASGDAEMMVSPITAPPQRVRVTMALRTLEPRRIRVVVDDQAVASAELLPDTLHTLAFEHPLLSRNTRIRLLTDTPAQVASPQDPRRLAWALMSFEMTGTTPSEKP